MKKTLLILISISTLFYGCDHNLSHNEHSTANVEMADDHQVSDLKLNDGEKWKINKEMVPYLVSSENLLKNLNNSDYKTLADSLNERNKKLISSCTMDGESHEQLHIWLVPHMEHIKKLSNAMTEEEAEKEVAEIKNSFKKFHTYFETE